MIELGKLKSNRCFAKSEAAGLLCFLLPHSGHKWFPKGKIRGFLKTTNRLSEPSDTKVIKVSHCKNHV